MGALVIKSSDRMFYHVIVEYSDSVARKNQKVYGFDYTNLDEIEDEIVLPFLSKQSFLVDGTRIEIGAKSVKVFESSFPIDECVELVNRQTPPNIVVYFGKEDILPSDSVVTDITKTVFKHAKERTGQEEGQKRIETVNSRNVFVVHGHDDGARESVESFLRSIGMTPIVLFEQHNKGKTIIEKIESFVDDVVYAIVLYTPCDEGKAKEDTQFMNRARQNVVFEHGYLMGRIGRERITALVKDKVETPGDMNGVVYVEMDDKNAWRFKIAKELNVLGVEVDFTKISL